MQSNIWKLYVIKGSVWFMLHIPILVLFLTDNGLTLHQVFLLHAIRSVVVAIAEIPSGYFADVFGRKLSITIGLGIMVIGFIVFSLSYQFSEFVGAVILLGIGISFISGSDTALMYETLVQLKKEKDFVKVEGKTVAIGNLSESIAFFISGFLALISLRTNFYCQIGIAFIGFIFSFFLTEPPTQSKHFLQKKQGWTNIKKIIRYSLIEHRTLRLYIFYSTMLGFSSLSMVWLIQTYFKEINLSVVYFGVLGAFLNVIVAIGAAYSHYFIKKISLKTLLLLLLLCNTLGFIIPGTSLSYVMISVFILFYFSRGIGSTLGRKMISENSPSEMRATIMSIKSFVLRIFYAAIFPFIGYIADWYSIKEAFLFSGITILFLGIIPLYFLYGKKVEKK